MKVVINTSDKQFERRTVIKEGLYESLPFLLKTHIRANTNMGTRSTNKTFGGSPQCTEENMDYALKKLKEYSDPKIKYTFRQWMNRFMNVLDLID